MSTTTFVRSATCRALIGRVALEPQLGVGLVDGEDEVVLARQRGGALVELDASPWPPSGCWGSSATAARRRPSRRRRGRAASRARDRAASSTTARRRTAPRGRPPDSRASVTTTRSPWAGEHLREVEDGLLGALRGDDLGVGVQGGAEAALPPSRRSPRAARAAPRPTGRSSTGSSASACSRARGMNAGVTSRGSPMPKSMTSTPRAIAACLASINRRNGIARHAREDRVHAHAKASIVS